MEERQRALMAAATQSMERGLSDNALWCMELAEGMRDADAAADVEEHDAEESSAEECGGGSGGEAEDDDDEELVQEAVLLMQADEHLRAHKLLEKRLGVCDDGAGAPGAATALLPASSAHAALSLDSAAARRAGPSPSQPPPRPPSAKLYFVCYHALWLTGEREAHEALLSKETLLSEGRKPNPRHAELHSTLAKLVHPTPQSRQRRRRCGRDVSGDAYLLYLTGLVLRERGQEREAAACFVRSVVREPLLWLAWKGLLGCGLDVLAEVRAAFRAAGHASPPWVYDIFKAELHLKNHSERAAGLFEQVRGGGGGGGAGFPTAPNLLASHATACYQSEDIPAARRLFRSLTRAHPFRLGGLDAYSNLLYLEKTPAALSKLASRAYHTNPYCYEAQCILGNLCSRENRSGDSISHFIKALQLNRRCHSAWTYLGHEYSPDQSAGARNLKACILCYMKAVETEPRDYRAWLGLAQVHLSQLNNLQLAWHYAERCLALKPDDQRLEAYAADLRSRLAFANNAAMTPASSSYSMLTNS
eukprot:Rhum_TRINITY_DN9508_c0_g1::Rhum_TRINITY_DN9508_c0_g1_i1::g.33829::m.33829/K03355/APC8, CDC23; anaphase-promoting complex subunit 8